MADGAGMISRVMDIGRGNSLGSWECARDIDAIVGEFAGSDKLRGLAAAQEKGTRGAARNESGRARRHAAEKRASISPRRKAPGAGAG